MSEKQAILYMHIATFLFGMTAIIGKLISLNEFNMVWHRMFLTSILFMFMPSFWKHLKHTSKKTLGIFFLNGIIVTLHWLTFYGSIKINNNVSLTLACFGSVSVFAAIFEPIIIKNKFKTSELILGFVVLIGLLFIAKANPDNSFTFESDYMKAIILAIISSLLAAFFTIFNKKYIAQNNPTVVTWAQMTGGLIFLTFILPFIFKYNISFEWIPSKIDSFWLVILALVCTNIAFTFEMQSLKKISAFTSSIILNLEPVYGIIAAIIIFNENENLNKWFYIGTTIITISVFAQAYISRINKTQRKAANT